MPIDGNTYFITNRKYYYAKLTQWGTKSRDVGTLEDFYASQIWELKEDRYLKGWYYIVNGERPKYR